MMERQGRRRSRDFPVPGMGFVLFWFIVGFFILAFVCLLAYLVLFSFKVGASGMRRGTWRDQKVNRIGVHDVKTPKIQ